MLHWLKMRYILIGVALASILAWYASQDSYSDIRRACANPARVEIVDPMGWSQYIEGVKHKKSESKDPRDFRVLYQNGFETHVKRNSYKKNKIINIENRVYKDGKLIAVIHTHELTIYRWYFSGPDFWNCQSGYTKIFVESLINSGVNAND